MSTVDHLICLLALLILLSFCSPNIQQKILTNIQKLQAQSPLMQNYTCTTSIKMLNFCSEINYPISSSINQIATDKLAKEYYEESLREVNAREPTCMHELRRFHCAAAFPRCDDNKEGHLVCMKLCRAWIGICVYGQNEEKVCGTDSNPGKLIALPPNCTIYGKEYSASGFTSLSFTTALVIVFSFLLL